MTAQSDIALWQQLQATAQALTAIESGQSSTQVLPQVAAALRPGVQALLFHVLRRLGRARALRNALVSKQPPVGINALLCTALALACDAQAAPYPAHTLVSQAVEAAKRTPSLRAQSAFLNACLRRFLREQASLLQQTDASPQALWNHPTWWIERLRKDHPQHWQDILRANAQPAPMVLRVNTRQTRRDDLRARWQAEGINAHALGDQGLVLDKPLPVQAIPGFAQGLCSVQDGGAQRAAPLLLGGLSPLPGQPLRILDACAAPGGKTAHLLECADAEVVALDVDAQRSARIVENLTRLQLHATVQTADALDTQAWWDGRLFDAILLDAPCTASGIVRRHPDVRWLRRASDVDQLAAVQQRLLATLWPLLRARGRLLYCTCSVFKAEGEGTVQAFLARNTDAALLPSPGHLFPQSASQAGGLKDNADGEHDGFYYALLQKNA